MESGPDVVDTLVVPDNGVVVAAAAVVVVADLAAG
jgi:hypothetical protein